MPGQGNNILYIVLYTMSSEGKKLSEQGRSNSQKGYGATDQSVGEVLTAPVISKLNKRRNSTGKINADSLEPPPVERRDSKTSDFVRRSSEARLLDQEDLEFAQQIEKKRSFAGIPDEEEVHRSDGQQDDFEFNHYGMTSEKAVDLLKEWGRNELEEDTTPLWYIFVSQLWQPMPIMIWCAAVVEALISNWIDMSILLFIQFANASIGFYEITKAGDAVAALKASLKPVATVRRDNKWQVIDAAEVVPGDCVMLASGSAVPADCRLNPKPPDAAKEKADPNIEVDQAALTGESLPVSMYANDSVKMGSTVVKGEAEGTVEFTGSNTFFGKTASMLNGTPEISNMQKILIAIVIVLTVLSGVLCTIVFIYLLHHGEEVNTALGFTVVLMVASIPMAIEIVTTTTLSLGSKELSDRGAIVTRLTAIEDMAGMNILCSDKTGTLTLNKMVIQDNSPTYVSGESQYSMLRYAAMAARWHEPPKDALDTLILTQVDMPSMSAVEQLDYVPFDPTTKRTEGTVKENGKTFKASKGAPHILLKLLDDSHNSRVVRQAVEDDVLALGMRGIRCLAVAKTDPTTGEWSILGLLTFLDPPRPDTKQTIIDSKAYGVNVKMITGDHLLIARETARQLEMGTNITDAANLPMLDPETKEAPPNLVENYGAHCYAHDGFAQVFPEHKYLIVETLRQMGFKTGMTGDGVNDAPALKRADVGVAVQGATDAARAASDIVLTRPGLSTIVYAIITARKVFVRIRNFITYRVAATLQLLIFFFIATFTLHPSKFEPSPEEIAQYPNYPDANMHWPPFFHMPVLMVRFIHFKNPYSLV